MIFGVLGGTFLEPSPLNWLFGNGIGTNIGASLLWGIGLVCGSYFVSRSVNLLNVKLDHLIRSHKRHADAINRVEKGLTQLHESHIALHRKVDGLVK